MRRLSLHVALIALLAAPVIHVSAGGDVAAITLPRPETKGGRPLMQVLKDRQTSRSFSGRKLPPKELSNLLWAAFGINRTDSGKRTAPSAVNWQEIDIYVALEEGLYLYDAQKHVLESVLQKDLRDQAGTQPFVKDAPACLIYVANYADMGTAEEDHKKFYAAVDTGFISQNVYLYCASEGLVTVVLGLVDRPALAEAMGLSDAQAVILSQPVGYPAE